MAKLKIDVTELSADERATLMKQIQHLSDLDSAIDQISNDLELKAGDIGVSYAYLMDRLTKPIKPNGKTKAAPVYQDPENPELTWSGRGKRPAWFKARLEEGIPVDYLRV